MNRIVSLSSEIEIQEDGERAREKGIHQTTSFEGHILGFDEAVFSERPTKLLLMVDESGEYVGVLHVQGMRDLDRYLATIAAIDVAPYVKLRYAGTTKTNGGRLLRRIAWKFDPSRDVKRSSLTPASPEPFEETPS